MRSGAFKRSKLKHIEYICSSCDACKHNMSNVYFSYSAVAAQRWEELSYKFHTLKAALEWLERPAFPSFERFFVPGRLSESYWDSIDIIRLASTNISMLAQANMLAREEDNQKRINEAFYQRAAEWDDVSWNRRCNTMQPMLAVTLAMGTRTRLGDEDA